MRERETAQSIDTCGKHDFMDPMDGLASASAAHSASHGDAGQQPSTSKRGNEVLAFALLGEGESPNKQHKLDMHTPAKGSDYAQFPKISGQSGNQNADMASVLRDMMAFQQQ